MPDSSTLYMASGYLPSQDGREILLYYSGSAHTHGGIATPDAAATWGNNVSSHTTMPVLPNSFNHRSI